MGVARCRVRERAAEPYRASTAPLSPDAREELAEEIRSLAAHLHAGTARLLALIARFDASGSWKPDGHRACANWLSLETGYSVRVARELVRAGRAMAELPETSTSMGRGALSLCQVRALTRVATPETEKDLLALAEHCSTAVLERECRAWKTRSRKEEAERERELHDARRLVLYPDGNGMHRLDANLMPETAATMRRALDLARFALYRQARGDGCLPESSPEESTRQYADALGLVAEWALAGGSGPIRFSKDKSFEGAIRIVQKLDTSRMKMARIATDTYLHGDTGNEAPVMPKIYNYFATWGPAKVFVNGEEVIPMIGSHTMFTEQARGASGRIVNAQGQVYSPTARDKTGFTDPSKTEFHFVTHTTEPDSDNFPPHTGWIHLHFSDVKVMQKPAGEQIPYRGD
jgi:hypothetical protein